MAKTSHQNRTRNLRRLAALAAIGLISFSGSSPAAANQTIDSDKLVNTTEASDGLIIVSDGTADTTATWTNSLGMTTVSTDADSAGLVFSDGGTAGAGDTILKLSDPGFYIIKNGGIRNENTESAAIIDMSRGSILRVSNGDIMGGNSSLLRGPGAVLQIKSDGAFFQAANSDVTGNVEFIGNDLTRKSTSIYEVGSLGEKGAATITTRGPNQISLTVNTNFGAAGGSKLTLGGDTGTAATIGGNIGSNTAGAPANSIIMNGSSTLDVAGAALGALNVKNAGSKDSFTLNTLGDSGNLSLDGRISIKKIVGETAIQAQDGATGNVYLWDDNTLSYTDLGSATDNLNLTLGADDDATSDRLNLNMGDTIRGGTGGAASTTTVINIDTANANLVNKNVVNDNIDVDGQVEINLIGNSSSLRLGELAAGSNLTLGTKDAIDTKKTVRFVDGLRGDTVDGDGNNVFTNVKVTGDVNLLADSAEDNLNIVNTNQVDRSAVITKMGTGILNVGRDNVKDSTAAVSVDTIVAGADVQIGSVAGDRGQVTLKYQGITAGDGATNTRIELKNAILKITDDDAAVDSSYGLENLKAGEFTMDSTDGESRLMSDTGDTLTIASGLAPTVTVGAGGNAIIESDHLQYNEVLKSSNTLGAAGAVHFDADALANDNKMIFRSSDNTNNFNEGVEIAEGNWEFQGSTTFKNTAAADQNKMTGSDIYFTGNQLATVAEGAEVDMSDPANASSIFKVDVAGNPIDAAGSTLHLNKNVQLSYLSGSLGQVDDVVLGGENETLLSFDTAHNTLLSAKNITIGQALTDFSILRGGDKAAVKGSVWVGGQAPAAGTAATTGLAADSITLHNRLTVDGALTITKALNGVDPSIIIGAGEAGFTLTENSTDVSSIEAGTKVEINTKLFPALGSSRFAAIDILDSTDTSQAARNMIAGMTDHLEISNLDELKREGFTGTGKVYDDGLVLVKVDDGGSYSVPKFARNMVSAIDAGGLMTGNNFDQLGGYLELDGAGSEKQFQRELTQIMGNTMNSSLSLVQNGATQAFSRLNASAPTIAGYRTAQAVAAPRRAPVVQAPAPSTNIGVPIRATDPVPAQPQQPAAVPPAPIAPASGSDDGRPNGFWITPNYIQMSMDGNYREGYGDYDVKSMGMIMGYDKWVNENARLGAFLSYSSPKLENDFQEITADDIQVGLYAQGVMPNGVILNAALAVGRQDYSSKRDIELGLANWNQNITADYNGSSVSAALEASRPVTFENDMYMRPAIGYSIQNISLDDIREESNNAAYNLAQKVSSGSFNIQQARLGTDIGWVNPDNTVTVTGKAFLVANLGDTQPEGRASFITADARTFNIYGAELDDTMANLGLGLKFTPAGQEGLIISLDYDALLGSNTQAHNLGLMIRYEF